MHSPTASIELNTQRQLMTYSIWSWVLKESAHGTWDIISIGMAILEIPHKTLIDSSVSWHSKGFTCTDICPVIVIHY